MDAGNADDESETGAGAAAIVHCLKFLAQEAAVLDLPETLLAIEAALNVAAKESGAAADEPILQPSLH